MELSCFLHYLTKYFSQSVRKLANFLQGLKFSTRVIEWGIETLRDVGVSLLTGALLGWLVGELKSIWVVILLLVAALLWYISITSIYLIKDKDA
jgi:ABC-type uncharacterized transport system permease subunit